MPRKRGNGAGHGGPANGPGWGGAAKGAATSRIEAGPAGDAIRALRWDGEHAAQKAEVAAQMRAVLYQVALAGEHEASRINAADKLLDRIEGKATQRVEVRDTTPDEMTDEELAAIASRGRRATTGTAAAEE